MRAPLKTALASWAPSINIIIIIIIIIILLLLLYGREIRRLLRKEVGCKNRPRDVRSCQPTPREEGGANLGSRLGGRNCKSEIKDTWCIIFLRGDCSALMRP